MQNHTTINNNKQQCKTIKNSWRISLSLQSKHCNMFIDPNKSSQRNYQIQFRCLSNGIRVRKQFVYISKYLVRFFIKYQCNHLKTVDRMTTLRVRMVVFAFSFFFLSLVQYMNEVAVSNFVCNAVVSVAPIPSGLWHMSNVFPTDFVNSWSIYCMFSMQKKNERKKINSTRTRTDFGANFIASNLEAAAAPLIELSNV